MIPIQGSSWHRLIYMAITLTLALSMLTSCGGGKDNDGITPPPDGGDTGSVDVILDESTVTLDEKGGEVVLKDGTKLTVPAGALSGKATVGLKKLSYPQDFGGESLAYDITGLSGAVGAMTLTFRAERALTAEEVNVVRYDTDEHEAAEIPYTYNPASGLVVVTINPTDMATTSVSETSTLSSGRILRVTEAAMDLTPHMKSPLYQAMEGGFRVLFEVTSYHSPSDPERLIKMPYYQQAGGACYFADVMMLARGYGLTNLRVHLGTVLRAGFEAGGVFDTNFGIDRTTGPLGGVLEYILGEFRAERINSGAELRGFVEMQHLRWEVLRQLDNGHPVILIYPGHTVLVIGYRDYGDTWILQDSQGQAPPNANEGGMYTIRPWSWISARQPNKTQVVRIAWLTAVPAAGRTLRTIGLPGGDETTGCAFGNFTFYQTNPRSGRQAPVAQLQFRPSKVDGYRWQYDSNDLQVIPNTATNLTMCYPIWNAAFTTAQVTVQMLVVTGSNRLFRQSYDFTLPAAADNITNATEGTINIPMGEIRRPALAEPDGTQKINIYVELQEGGTIIDGFTLEATLSVKPLISELTPASGKPGDEVTIEGSSFGMTQSTKSAVTIGGKIAQIVSWSESEITVKVPQDVASGEVQVIITTGEQYVYESNSFPWTVTGGPAMGSLTPTSGPVGTEVTISGSGFGAVQGSSTVTFNQTLASQIVSWKDNEIKVKVPNGATTGPVVVKRDGLNSNAVTFTIEGPQVKVITGQIDKEYSFTLPWNLGGYEQVVTTSGSWSLTAAGALLVFDSGAGGSLSIAQNNQATLSISASSTLKETYQRYDWSGGNYYYGYSGDGYTIMNWSEPKLVNREDSYSADGLTYTISVSDSSANVQFSFSSDEPQLYLHLETEVDMAWVGYDNEGNQLDSGVETSVFGAAYFKIEPA